MTIREITRLSGHRLAIAWGFVGTLLGAMTLVLLANQHRFDWELELIDIPAIPLAIGLVAAGLVFMLILPLVRATAREDEATQWGLLKLVLVVGLLLRLAMFWTEPALEDDQQRYLWEGGLIVHGISPYAVSPKDSRTAPGTTRLARIARDSRPVISRVNHPQLTTIYPPVAQGAFALAHVLKPWSITAWRFVLLGCEVISVALLMWLLAAVGKPLVWAALYWWNPIAIKELLNSGHMEGVLVVLVLAALALAVRGRPLMATAALGLAAGTKLWPVILAPLLWRPLLARPRTLLAAMAILAVMLGLWAAPVLLAGLDSRSGFVAYAAEWQTNSAHFPFLRGLVSRFIVAFGGTGDHAGTVVRIGLAGIAGAVALLLAARPVRSSFDFLDRASLITLALVIVSPVQFPWYMLWTMPLAVIVPRLGVLAMAVTVPLYYVSFHYSATDAYWIFRERWTWVIWLPIWVLLAAEAWRARAGGAGAPGLRAETRPRGDS